MQQCATSEDSDQPAHTQITLLKLQILMVSNRNFRSRVPAPLNMLKKLAILKAFKLLTDRSKAELLYLCSPLTYCMCLAALCSSVGKGAKAGVAGPAGAAFAGPTFLAEYAIHRVSLSRFVFFSLSLPLILFNHATIY